MNVYVVKMAGRYYAKREKNKQMTTEHLNKARIFSSDELFQATTIANEAILKGRANVFIAEIQEVRAFV